MATGETELRRGLSVTDAVAIVVGVIVGTGVFLKTGTMAQLLESPSMVLAAWVAAGILSLAGALTYAELGSIFPHAGGEYVYLKEAYGRLPAFLYGWTRFWIASPATIAAYAVGAATFLSGAVSLDFLGGKNVFAVLLVIAFSSLNCLQVKYGGKAQSIITALKMILIIGIPIGIFFFAGSGTVENLNAPAGSSGEFSINAFGMAMLAALWAYDGWNNMPMAGGEIENPQRNIPIALSLGMAVVLILYAFLNLAYFFALPYVEVMTSNSNAYPDALPVATKAAEQFLTSGHIGVVSVIFFFSAIGAMNGSILTSARVPYAMAKDGLFLRQLAHVSPKTHVPVVSVVVQAVISVVLALLGTFDQLTDYVIFSSWIFYGACCCSIFIFRRRGLSSKQKYRVPGYPIVPIVFVFVSIFLVLNTIYSAPQSSGIGLVIILAGIPVYAVFNRRKRGSVNG